MKQVLVIENDPGAPIGLLSDIMEEHGISYDLVPVERAGIPAIQGYSAVIVLGGFQHVANFDRYPYFVEEETLIRDAIDQDIAYLGICLGGQLLAHLLGAPVGPHTLFEVGFTEVQLTPDGVRDPLYRGLPENQLVFQWHLDAFGLPSQATLLATNKETPYQAFRYGDKAYGLQYHIEVLPETFQQWLQADARHLTETMGPEMVTRLLREWESQSPAYHRQSALMFANFLQVAGLLASEAAVGSGAV